MKKKFIQFLKDNGAYEKYVELYDPEYYAIRYTSIDTFLQSVKPYYYICWAFLWKSVFWVELHEKWIKTMNQYGKTD